MQKEFIPYEQALALKELGFDEPCFGYQVKGQKTSTQLKITNSKLEKQALKYRSTYKGILPLMVAKPLYQQAFRWFREKYGLFAEITLWGDGLGYISMIKEIKQEEFIEVYKKDIVDTGLPIWKYEEAELSCLKKLIEIVKEQK